MRLIYLKFIFSSICVFAVFLISGCFSTLQTAKITDGFSFTGGLYSYSIERYSYPESHYENHYLIVLMPRSGWPASEKKFGWEIGIRLISDWIDPDDPDNPIWLFLEEFKLQIPRNRYFDLAFGADFYLIYPGSIYMIVSKDISKTFTLYGSGELFGGLYSITLGENETGFYPKLTLGSEIRLHRNFAVLVEMERWFNTDWDSRENLRFATGLKFTPPK